MKKSGWVFCWLLVLASAALAQPLPDSDGALVPEPGTIFLMGAGLASLGYLAWRRKRNK